MADVEDPTPQIPVIGRGESLATGFVNPSTVSPPTEEQVKELEAHNEEDDTESGDEESPVKELSKERSEAIIVGRI